MKKLIAASIVLLGLLLLWSCNTSDPGKDVFNIQGDTAWTRCDSLLIVLKDKDGNVLDTLFNDSLKDIEQLKNLSADKYKGGEAQIFIKGVKQGGLCFEQNRTFDESNGKVTVDTVSDTAAKPVAVQATPDDTLKLALGESAFAEARVKPSYADQGIIWFQEGDAGVVTVEVQPGNSPSRLKVIAAAAGDARLVAVSKKDTTKKDVVYIKVLKAASKSLTLSKDSLSLFQGGPGDSLSAAVLPPEASQAVTWASRDSSVATVDSNGRVAPVKAGTTYVVATSKENSGSDSARVVVVLDVPVLTVNSKGGAPVNAQLIFSAVVKQSFGTLVLYKWDLDGDGTWDDSLHGPWSGDSVDLPAVSTKYSKEGTFKAKFLVRDGEGNEATVESPVDIGNQPPEISALRADTTISIKDSISLTATLHDVDGKVAAYAWDYDGDGVFDDSATVSDSTVHLASGHRYPAAGDIKTILRAVDDNGKARLDTIKIKVELDPPVADAGPDVSITAGSPLEVHIKGTDKYGAIAKREFKLGSGSYITVSKQDTTVLTPATPGPLTISVRVTDDDGNTAEDSALVTLIAPSKSNDDLALLTPSAGSLTPAFKPVTLFYSLAVGYADSQVTVSAVPSDPAAVIAVNGKPVASGAASDPVDVKVGTTVNVFQIVVTAQDGSQKVYSLSVTRAPSTDSKLAKLEATGFSLKPSFDPAVLDYADTVGFGVTSVKLTPTASHPAAKVTVNDTLLASGVLSNALNLLPGDNLIKVVVTAQDNATKTTYKIHVVRKGKLVVYQGLGVFTPATVIDSSEQVIGSSIKLKHAPVAGYHFLHWSVTQGQASIGDTAADSTTLIMDSSIVRVQANFAINVYTITTKVTGTLGGIFSPDSIRIDYGKDTTITINPLAGFRVLSVTDNGNAVSTLGSAFGPRTYKLTNVTGDHQITASFRKFYVMSASVTGSGQVIQPLSPVNVDEGGTYEFQFQSSAAGQTLGTLSDGGVGVPSGSITGDSMGVIKYSVTADKDHNVAAGYVIKTYTLKVYGHDLCVQGHCTGIYCLFCFSGRGTGPDSVVTTVNWGSSYDVTTADSNAAKQPFLYWYKNGVKSDTTTYTLVSNITSNTTVSAIYKSIIKPPPCCITGSCCILQGPTPVQQTTIPMAAPQSMEIIDKP